MPSMSKVNVSFLPSMTKPSNYNLLILLVISALCAIVPLDLTQLIFAVLGALCYYMVQSLQRSMGLPGQKKLPKSPIEKAEPREVKKRRTNRKPLTEGTHVDAAAQPACVPILAPKFKGESLEDEVQELIAQIMPTASSQRGVDRLAEAIRVMLASSLPEVEVTGFANSDLSRGRANGVAVPDVDIVIQVRPDSVASKLPSKGVAEPRMLQKWALRICADRLVSGGFKFRRSGFRGNEPKMTLLVPSELKIFDTAVPIDISVNAVTPLHSAALISECGNLNPQSKELILLIRRWAKDRGICHAPKGHLSPYVWSLLVVYYLQVAQKEPLLPPVAEFQAIKDLLPAGCGKTAQPWRGKASELTAAELLKGFMQFYNSFPWKSEAVCVLKGTQGPMPLSLPIHIIEHEDGPKSTECGPNIEDPFAPKKNLGSGMTWWSWLRMKEELARAHTLLEQDTSLSTLLAPWSPEGPEEASRN
mmetsp:Transcript_30860/g.66539  ORF Transcript_30860/g.66539 Transcript_30860/m.66539 type:complete len:475 (+) Transcript_30860:123-1547(+)